MALCSTGTLMGPTELDFSGPGNAETAAIRNRLAVLRAEQAALQARLAELEPDRANVRSSQSSPLDEAPVTASSSPAEKIALFRSLFRGREDVYPKRWSNPRSGRSGYAPACANEWAPRICDKPRIKCRECPNQAFIPVTAEVFARHLQGRGADGRDFTIGVYPMLADETCWFLAIDFDKQTWHRDVAVFLATCRALGVAAALERSRSATAATCGSSSLIRSRRRRLGVLEHGCLPSRWTLRQKKTLPSALLRLYKDVPMGPTWLR